MKTYELTYIIAPDITPEEAEAKGKEIESLLQSEEGVIVRQTNPVAKTLSYQINGRASGFLGVIEFQLEPGHLDKIEKNIQKDEKIIRRIILIKKPAKMKKIRRIKNDFAPAFRAEEPKPEDKPEDRQKEKVELKDIEERLNEILGE